MHCSVSVTLGKLLSISDSHLEIQIKVLFRGVDMANFKTAFRLELQYYLLPGSPVCLSTLEIFFLDLPVYIIT